MVLAYDGRKNAGTKSGNVPIAPARNKSKNLGSRKGLLWRALIRRGRDADEGQ